MGHTLWKERTSSSKLPLTCAYTTHTHKHRGLFVLATTQGHEACLGMWLLILRDMPFEKTDFPFLIRYQLQTASRLEMKLCIHFPFSVLGFGQIWTYAALAQAAAVSVRSCMYQSCYVWRHCSFRVLHHISCIGPWTWGQGFDDDIMFSFCHRPHNVQLRVSTH